LIQLLSDYCITIWSCLSVKIGLLSFSQYIIEQQFMNNFNRDGGGRSRGDRRGRRERPSMHETTCDDCGRLCEVPFRPSGDKPVYCNSCFGREEASDYRDDRRDRRREDRRGRDRRDRGDRSERRMYEVKCDECGDMCEVPFKPSGDKPVYCDGCFGKSDSSRPSKADQSNKKHDEINEKLDTILILLQRLVSAKDVDKPKKTVKAVKKVVEDLVEMKDAKTAKKAAPKKAAAKKTATKKVTKKAPAKKVAKKTTTNKSAAKKK